MPKTPKTQTVPAELAHVSGRLRRRSCSLPTSDSYPVRSITVVEGVKRFGGRSTSPDRSPTPRQWVCEPRHPSPRCGVGDAPYLIP